MILVTKPERWILVGGQQEGIRFHPNGPTSYANDKAKERSWVAACKQNGKPGNDYAHQRGHAEERKNNIMRDRQEPFYQW